MKVIIFLLFLVLKMKSVSATDQEGYIIKSIGDTAWGKVDVQMKKVVFGKKELDLADMEQEIYFTENNSKTKKIKAGEVIGYGFNYSDVWFHFEVLDWPKNNWKKNTTAFERKVNKLTLFIHRAYDGAVPIYKDYYKATGNAMGLPGSKSQNTITELYIHTTDLGYVEVTPASSGANKKLKDFFMKYLNMEDAFLNTIDDKAKFSEAEEILMAYNEWKKRN
ncbi:MAG: hypothetical protein ACRDEB_09510 [Chitinophagaceae bacterium]